MRKYVLNSPIITTWGLFKFEPISLKEAQKFLEDSEFESAIGHEGTAQLLSSLLGKEIKANRIQIEMKRGDSALVVRLKIRLKEGEVLGYHELKELYERGEIELGLLTRVE